MDTGVDVISVLKQATAAHKTGNLREAETLYRSVLGFTDNASPKILLANVLLHTGLLKQSPESARAEALRLAEDAMYGLDLGTVGTDPVPCASTLNPSQQRLLHTRYGYFLLQYGGCVRLDGNWGHSAGSTLNGADMSAESRRALLDKAILHLEAATGPPGRVKDTGSDPLVWRNLSLAYSSCGRLADAERACAQCVAATPCSSPSAWEAHYKHGKALKRIGEEAQALGKYCDAAESSKGHEMPMFWLRVAAAGGAKAALSAEIMERIKGILVRYSSANPGIGTSPSLAPAVPHEYIRKLFDGYARTFDEHLVGKLGYTTPSKLLSLVSKTLEADGLDVGNSNGEVAPTQPLWTACADLGCGTGLAGVAFRPLVRYLAGVDLSPGMVAEARARNAGMLAMHGSVGPLYDDLGVGDISAWMEGQLQSHGRGFDLLLAADVLVYIGDLRRVFAVAEASMRAAVLGRVIHARAPTSGGGTAAVVASEGNDAGQLASPYFVFSTESLEASSTVIDALGSGQAVSSGPGFALTGTGRCVHSRSYIDGLCAAHGFSVRAAKREVIRQNAGKDVWGDLYVLLYTGQ